MNRWLSIGTYAILLCLTASAALAQQKTARECREEWRSNKDAYRAANIAERVYVEKCRAGEAIALPAAPAAAPSAATPTAPAAPAKTARECREEWRSNKDAYRAANIAERVYVEKCRAGEAIALPAAPAAAPSPANPTAPTAAAPVRPPSPPRPLPEAAPAPTRPAEPTAAPVAPAKLDQFETEGQAKAHCPADLVVWANFTSKIYHFAGHRSYGATKHGAYMCEKEATAQGFRASRTETRPGT